MVRFGEDPDVLLNSGFQGGQPHVGTEAGQLRVTEGAGSERQSYYEAQVAAFVFAFGGFRKASGRRRHFSNRRLTFHAPVAKISR